MNGKIGIRDVAAHAGVSIGTVSNVLNGLATVKPHNRARVEAAMSELGFVPNLHARQLRVGHSDAIAMVVLNIANPLYAEVAHVADAVAHGHDSTIVIASSDQDPEREARYLSMFVASRVRGLLVAPVSGITPQLQRVRDGGTPLVLLDDHLDDTEFCSVSLDGAAAGALGAEHLLAIGRRRIAVVGGPITQISDRVSGAGKAVGGHGSSLLSIIETDDLTVEEGRRAASRILDLPAASRPDGVFAANDLLAIGLLMEFVLAGVSIPGDIAVVGYDDIDFAATAIVPLTSVAQPRADIARQAIRLILDEEADPDHRHEKMLLPPTLAVRASTIG